MDKVREVGKAEGLVKLTIVKLPKQGYGVRKRFRVWSAFRRPRNYWREGKLETALDPEDAVDLLKSEAVELRRQGYTVQIGGTATTQSLVKRYSKSSQLGSLGNTTLFITSDSSTGFPLGVVEVKK